MKAFSLSLLHWLAVIGCAAAQDAYLYNLDIQPRATSSPKAASIDSETANAILARRFGATEQRRLGPVEDVVLEHLNQYGGQQTISLFGDEAASSMSNRLLIAIEGYDGEPLPVSPGVKIERAESCLANTNQLTALVDEECFDTSSCVEFISLKCGMHVMYMCDPKAGSCMDRGTVVRMLGGDTQSPVKGDQKAILNALNTHRGRRSRTVIKMDARYMDQFSREARNSAIKETFNIWYKVLEPLAKAGKIESTILLLPSHRAPPSLNLNRRQMTQNELEAPLSQPFVSVSTPDSSSSSISNSNSNSTHHQLPPLGTFLPSCFSSNTTCTDTTNTCSGHGFCYAKSSNCFACRCGSTIVRQDSDGKNVKTVAWGGTACERKDVSVPFFLFAGFGVLMTAIVVGAVGMLYGMGSEELPSVIGAGVTGPRAQR